MVVLVTCKNEEDHRLKNVDFSYFCSKHRLLVHVRAEAVLTSTNKLFFFFFDQK